MNKKIVNILLALVAVMGLFSVGAQIFNANTTTADQRQKITFWHSMGGVNKTALETIVANYNQSQDKYEVIPSYQGEYAENLAKFQSVAGTSSAPNLVQVQEIGTQTMLDNQNYIPVQDLADDEGLDLSMIEEPIANYYSYDGKLQSMPFNSSTPVVYYNKDLLAAVGYDHFPETYEEIADIGEKLKAAGYETKGFSLLVYGWLFEELIANQGNLLMNNENGKAGVPTEVAFNNQDTRDMLQWVQEMIAADTFVNYSTNGNDMAAGFLNQDVAIIMNSSAGAKQIFDTATFNVGIGYVPYPEGKERTGVAIGGASVWITKDKPAAEIAGTWDFMKYLMTPEVQAAWSLDTGYFPVNREAYDEQIMIDAYAKNPELQQAANQLHDTKNVPATQGVLTNVITESRKIIEAGMDRIYNGADIDQTINEVSRDVNSALSQSNRSNGKN